MKETKKIDLKSAMNTDRSYIGKRKRSVRKVLCSKLARVAELHEPVELDRDLEYAQRLNVLHVWNEQPDWRVHRKSDVVRCLDERTDK